MENKNMPAFPTTHSIDNGIAISQQVGESTWQAVGLTKRELIAAQMDVRNDIADYSLEFLQRLVGRERPSAVSPRELLVWDAEAEAIIRIIKADALLAELSKS